MIALICTECGRIIDDNPLAIECLCGNILAVPKVDTDE